MSSIKDQVIKALEKAAGVKSPVVEFAQREEFGDYSSNIALVLAKEKKVNPQKLAEEIAEKINQEGGLPAVASTKAGFINFWLKKEVLIDSLICNEIPAVGKGKTVVIDYSSPNIAKRFGIGHLRSTVIGQALYNLYKCLGYKVIGDNHLGDWGTQFGVLLFQIVRKNLDPAKLSIDELEFLYVDFHKEQENQPELHDQAKLWFKKLEEGNVQAKKIWQVLVKTSLAEFDRIYKRLGVSLDYAYGESFYQDKMPQVLEEARVKKISKKSEGAEIIEFSGLPPAMLVKGDGTTTYFTRDLATVRYRLDTWQPDLFIYEVGADQTLHFKQLFAAVKLLGWVKNEQLVHIAHGLIRFEHGKMSTRKGQGIKLEEILDEAVTRAKKLGNNDEKVAEMVGIGSVKYFDLLHQPGGDIIFDWEKMFLLEGNSGPYLQYTYARAHSVLAKIPNPKLQTLNKLKIRNYKLEIEELAILRTLIKFSGIVIASATAYSPNILCSYLFDLAQKFNAFYNKRRILPIDSTRQVGSANTWRVYEFRILLTTAVGRVLKNGLGILGIQAPQKM